MKTIFTAILIVIAFASNAQNSKYYEILKQMSELINKDKGMITTLIQDRHPIRKSEFGTGNVYLLNRSTEITVTYKNEKIAFLMLKVISDSDRIMGYSEALKNFKFIEYDMYTGARYLDAETNIYLDASKTLNKHEFNIMFVKPQ